MTVWITSDTEVGKKIVVLCINSSFWNCTIRFTRNMVIKLSYKECCLHGNYTSIRQGLYFHFVSFYAIQKMWNRTMLFTYIYIQCNIPICLHWKFATFNFLWIHLQGSLWILTLMGPWPINIKIHGPSAGGIRGLR